MKNIITLLLLAVLISCDNDPKVKQNTVAETGLPELNAATNLINSEPENAANYFERAKIYTNNQAYQEAIEDLKIAIKLDSTNISYRHLLADGYLDNYQSKKALDVLETTAELFPNSSLTKLKLSEFYLILKQHESSIKNIGRILAQDPQNAEAHFMMGMNLKEMGDTTQAINSFKNAVEIEPELIDGWINIGSIYEEQKNPKALDFYNAALEVNSKNINALHSKAFYLQNNDDVYGAIEIYRKIMQLDRQYAAAPLNAGILYLGIDSFALAYEHFNILALNSPADAKAYYYRGFSQELQGNKKAAEEDYNICLRINPDDESAQKGLIRVKSE